MDRLIAKWETEDSRGKTVAAPAIAQGKKAATANEPLDVLKFYRLFQERLLEGDPETLKLIKNGKMPLTASQMRQLMDQWEKKSLAANGSKPKSDENTDQPPADNGLAEKRSAGQGRCGEGRCDDGPAEKGPRGKGCRAAPAAAQATAGNPAAHASKGQCRGPSPSCAT